MSTHINNLPDSSASGNSKMPEYLMLAFFGWLILKALWNVFGG